MTGVQTCALPIFVSFAVVSMERVFIPAPFANLILPLLFDTKLITPSNELAWSSVAVM